MKRKGASWQHLVVTPCGFMALVLLVGSLSSSSSPSFHGEAFQLRSSVTQRLDRDTETSTKSINTRTLGQERFRTQNRQLSSSVLLYPKSSSLLLIRPLTLLARSNSRPDDEENGGADDSVSTTLIGKGTFMKVDKLVLSSSSENLVVLGELHVTGKLQCSGAPETKNTLRQWGSSSRGNSSSSNTNNMLVKGIFHGNVKGMDTVRIGGKFFGNIQCSSLIVESDGEVCGDVNVHSLTLKPGGRIEGIAKCELIASDDEGARVQDADRFLENMVPKTNLFSDLRNGHDGTSSGASPKPVAMIDVESDGDSMPASQHRSSPFATETMHTVNGDIAYLNDEDVVNLVKHDVEAPEHQANGHQLSTDQNVYDRTNGVTVGKMIQRHENQEKAHQQQAPLDAPSRQQEQLQPMSPPGKLTDAFGNHLIGTAGDQHVDSLRRNREIVANTRSLLDSWREAETRPPPLPPIGSGNSKKRKSSEGDQRKATRGGGRSRDNSDDVPSFLQRR